MSKKNFFRIFWKKIFFSAKKNFSKIFLLFWIEDIHIYPSHPVRSQKSEKKFFWVWNIRFLCHEKIQFLKKQKNVSRYWHRLPNEPSLIKIHWAVPELYSRTDERTDEQSHDIALFASIREHKLAHSCSETSSAGLTALASRVKIMRKVSMHKPTNQTDFNTISQENSKGTRRMKMVSKARRFPVLKRDNASLEFFFT